MQLVKDHSPSNSGELYNLFQKHSKKKFETLVDELKEACEKENINIDKFTINSYLYDLFFVKTMKGRSEEKKLLDYLNKNGYKLRNATLQEEREYAVDLVNGKIAIQVKPESYLNFSNEEHRKQFFKNLEKNKKFNGKVFYYFY